MLTKREPHRNKIRVIINCADNMRTHICPAATGAAAGDTDMMHVEVHEDHFRALCLGKSSTQYGIEASPLLVAIERNPFYLLTQLLHHVGLDRLNILAILLIMLHGQFECFCKTNDTIEVF